MKHIDDKVYTGDCLATIHDIADTIRATYCHPKDELTLQDLATVYSASEIMGALIDGAELPKCICCESNFALVPCKACHEWVCMDCRKSAHVHGSGENVEGFDA